MLIIIVFTLGNVKYNESSRQPFHTRSDDGITLSTIATGEE